MIKIREGGTVQRRACYLALGVTVEGDRDVLGMWFQETEGAKFWMQVLTELKQRGVQDILICCVDGLKGFPEAIEAERTAPAGAPDADPQVRSVRLRSAAGVRIADASASCRHSWRGRRPTPA